MKIEVVAIEELNAAPYNPRVDLKPGDAAYERLKRCIEEFDLVEPLVWNRRSGHLVGGHQRLKILRYRGDTEVQVVVVDLPPEREKALNVALNNPHLAGDWDLNKLSGLLDELKTLPDFDATLTGFSDEDLNALLLAPDPNWSGSDDEESDSAGRVEVRLLAEPDTWDAIKPEIDGLIARYHVECHVRLPTGKSQ
jgi:ParB-like chromosome segregation protein Spo0J